jgi:phosphopantetheine adenylyltransferase
MGKKVVFAWGRFNPPTIGHGVVMKRVAKEAKARSADYAIFASKSNDPKKNPLTFRTKVKFLRQSFPKHSKNINGSPTIRTIVDVMKFLEKKYTEVSLVVGSDRAADLKKLLNHYNGREYDFENIEIISAGERDPDAEDVSGMSASKMRKAAAEGDYTSFRRGSPIKNPRALYNAIRNGMKITEEFYMMMEGIHAVNSIKGSKFNRLLRFGLVQTKEIPLTQRAFKNLKSSGPNPELRDRIFNVTSKVLQYVNDDNLLYNRLLVLLHNDYFEESQRDALLKRAQKSGFEYTTLLEIYLRGLISSPIYGDKTPQQYAFDRVNSFIAGGRSRNDLDSDIWDSHIQNRLNNTRIVKEVKLPPAEWGTKEMSDRYCKDTPGQPDDTAQIKSLISWAEAAPPGKDAEEFIKGNKEKFKKRYGTKWEKVLYATAWKVYGEKNK